MRDGLLALRLSALAETVDLRKSIQCVLSQMRSELPLQKPDSQGLQHKLGLNHYYEMSGKI